MQRFRNHAVTAFAALLALSCGDLRTDTLTDPPAHAVAQAACDFRIMNDLVRDYLPAGEWGPARTLLSQMEAAYRAGDRGGATSLGFNLLVLVEDAANGGTGGSPEAGSDLVNAVLACTNVDAAAHDWSGALSTGAFGVRGGPSDPAGPVLSRDSLSGIGIVTEATWFQVLGRRAVVYGEPDGSAIFNELLVGAAYDWSTLPALPQVNPGAIMGICVNTPATQLRLERVPGSNVHSILNLKDASFFLVCPAAVVAGQPGTNLAGPVGGSVKGFSDFGPVDAQAINLSYLNQPSTVPAGTIMTPGVRLVATGTGGTPLPEVTMTMSLVTLSGSGSLSGGLIKLTGPSGVESFPDLRVSAPGTYALLVSASLPGFATVQLQSAGFAVVP